MADEERLFVIRHKTLGYYHNQRVRSPYNYMDAGYSFLFHPEIKWAKIYNSIKIVEKLLNNNNNYIHDYKEDCEIVEVKIDVVGIVDI